MFVGLQPGKRWVRVHACECVGLVGCWGVHLHYSQIQLKEISHGGGIGE